jgi:hypothetical protein
MDGEEETWSVGSMDERLVVESVEKLEVDSVEKKDDSMGSYLVVELVTSKVA